jgi:hypothetical protein
MTVTTDQKIAAVDRLLDDLRWARGQDVLEAATFDALVEIAKELRAETPAEAGRVLLAMTDQVDRARQGRARLGFYDVGNAQTICEALCGRWWPTVRKAMERFETAEHGEGR